MAWTKYQLGLAFLMVVTGSINTLTTTWADKMTSISKDGKERPFEHPFVQASCMFFGEMICFFAFKILFCYHTSRNTIDESSLVKGNQAFNPFLFFPASMFDMLGTSLMYLGLNLTSPSSFQMLRGSVIVFVAILSKIFLHSEIGLKKWSGIILVILGLFVVGVSDFLISSDTQSSDTLKMVTGDVIIVGAQIITASQMVYEEKYVSERDIPPLQAVGWEGIWGFIVLGALLVPFNFILVPEPYQNNANGSLEDFVDAMVQIWNNKLLIVSLSGTIVSIAFFNFAGISVTKEMSATTRMILDSVRTLVVWAFSLAVSWQKFHPLQILGFVLLLLGMATYNNIIPYEKLPCMRRPRDEALVTSRSDSEP